MSITLVIEWINFETFNAKKMGGASHPSPSSRTQTQKSHGLKQKSLILAQIERWRRALHMQVERQHGLRSGGEWRTGE